MNLQTDKELYEFLSNAPKEFTENEKIKKFQLKNGDFIHCVLWNMHFYITGTDIVKILVWRFQNAGRQIISLKKFEEGVFSDLRNLKPGIDATLEGPRSDFLEFLYKNGCIRTQKKQKVFFWYSVPHDALFCDALERDLRRETNLYAYSKYYSKSNYATMPFKQYTPIGNMNQWPAPNQPQINQNLSSMNLQLSSNSQSMTNNLNTFYSSNQVNNYQENKFEMEKQFETQFDPNQFETQFDPNKFEPTYESSKIDQKLYDQKPLYDQKMYDQKQLYTQKQLYDQSQIYDQQQFLPYDKQFPRFKQFQDKHPQFYPKQFDPQSYDPSYDKPQQFDHQKQSLNDDLPFQMPDLEEEKTEEFVEPDMIIPNKGGKSEQ